MSVEESRAARAPVILVEDNEDDQMVARFCYRAAGISNPIIVCNGGPDFFVYLQRAALGEVPMPALVLLDINMPKMSGFDVLEKVRTHKEYQHLKVMMLSNSDNPQDMRRAEDLGADGYMVKPTDTVVYTKMFSDLDKAS